MNSSRDLQIWGAIIISALSSLAFGTALTLAFFRSDTGNLQLLIGAVIANASTVVSFWLGSSSGSKRKTDLMAQGQQQSQQSMSNVGSPLA